MGRLDWRWRPLARHVGLLAVAGILCALHGAHVDANGAEVGWREDFPVDKANLVDTGRNPYFILEPGHTLYLAHGKSTLTISVLNETQEIDGVKTRVVEERETENGQPTEIARNFFAIDKSTHDLYYFGEDVDIYKRGRVVGHGDAWRSGVKGAKFGLMMPGEPKVGDRFYQERAPRVAMDRCEIVSLTEESTTPAGTFHNCLRTRDSSAIESGSDYKLYAPGVGLIKDAEMVLVKVGDAGAARK